MGDWQVVDGTLNCVSSVKMRGEEQPAKISNDRARHYNKYYESPKIFQRQKEDCERPDKIELLFDTQTPKVTEKIRVMKTRNKTSDVVGKGDQPWPGVLPVFGDADKCVAGGAQNKEQKIERPNAKPSAPVESPHEQPKWAISLRQQNARDEKSGQHEEDLHPHPPERQ
jgi:hypothetical protein